MGRVDKVETDAVAGQPTDPGTMPVGVNLLGKLPCLDRDDGPALYDSRVITRHQTVYPYMMRLSPRKSGFPNP